MIQLIDECFHTDDFAQQAEYQAVIGTTTALINVIYSTGDLSDVMMGGIGYQNAPPQVLCKTGDVSDLSTTSCLIFNGITWYVREWFDDGTGVTTIKLSKDNING